jgi:hypothetical protein
VEDFAAPSSPWETTSFRVDSPSSRSGSVDVLAACVAEVLEPKETASRFSDDEDEDGCEEQHSRFAGMKRGILRLRKSSNAFLSPAQELVRFPLLCAFCLPFRH